ncbi:hypothetical protein [Serratia fonticola]|uniref:hypothetical protein n=1 Tax=Serratia fonticola TaxID=47917 RepID=UPI00192C89E6|nr:hypothetical protein [Serratia fonticola]MBL5905354.1 hypothetical protein [Serratia fonticola]
MQRLVYCQAVGASVCHISEGTIVIDRPVVYHVPSCYGMVFMDSKEQGMFEIISDLVGMVFRIIFGILEAIYEIVNFIYSFTKGRKWRRVVITILIFLALLGLFYWWIVNASQ